MIAVEPVKYFVSRRTTSVDNHVEDVISSTVKLVWLKILREEQ